MAVLRRHRNRSVVTAASALAPAARSPVPLRLRSSRRGSRGSSATAPASPSLGLCASESMVRRVSGDSAAAPLLPRQPPHSSRRRSRVRHAMAGAVLRIASMHAICVCVCEFDESAGGVTVGALFLPPCPPRPSSYLTGEPHQ
eukprot:343648-Chlamydomonas_euryale.AAC.4